MESAANINTKVQPMFYERDVRDPLRGSVIKALADYQEDINNSGAGYAIMSYAKQGLIDIDPSVDCQIFIDWYPRDQSYTILRLARSGKLSYKPQ